MSAPQPFRPCTYLEHHATTRPGTPAILEQGETIDFGQLYRRVRALMTYLRASGVGPGQVVAVCLPNVWEYVALEIAIPAIGAVVMPLAPSLGAYEVGSALERSGATVLVGALPGESPGVDAVPGESTGTDPGGRDRGVVTPGESPGAVPAAKSSPLASTADLRPSLRAVLGRDEVAAACQLDGCDAEVYPTSPEEIVQIALTSGTTGAPKLASLSARLKQLTFEGFTARLQMVPGDGVLPLSPISQGVGEMSLYALRLGACLVMAHEPRFDAEQALRLVASSRPTVLSGVPTMISRMLHCPVEADLSALRLTAVAGAPMPPEVAAAWEQRSGAPVCSFYGAMDIGQLAVGSPDDPVEQRWHSVGRPHEAAEVLVCDPDGRPLQAGEVGEVCMRGPLVQDRYWGEEAGPYAADGWAHFGDLGYLDTDGFLHVVGRTKDIVIRGGNNINPFELEAMLSDHPAVAEACLVGVPDPDLGERAVVFVVVRPGQRVSLDELLAFLATRGLARYKWPERLVVLDELPLGASGKVARRALRELAAAAEGAVDARAGGGTDARAGGGTGVPRRGYG